MSVPYVENQRTTQVSSVSADADTKAADLMVNNLVYKQPSALSLAVNRTYKRQYFQRNDYKNGETAVIDWNTGTDYVDPTNSYLRFDMRVLGTSGSVNFGSGSAMNIIRQVTIRSRSGTELDRVERCNVWARNESLYTYTDQWLETYGAVQGFGPNRDQTDNTLTVGGGYATFCIPLHRFAPFFRPTKKGQKLPPQLASGLHIEIIFENPTTALSDTTATPSVGLTGYEITNFHFMLDQIALTDETQMSLNMESAETGLEYTYPRIYTAISTVGVGETSVSSQIRKAVSQACVAYTTVLDQSNLNSVTDDSFEAVTFDTARWQYRLGALYFPHQPIEDGAGVTQLGRESYVNSLMMFDKLKHPFAETSVTPTDFVNGKALHCVSMEKDTMLNLSGLPVNNSRVLEFNVQFNAVAAAREVVTFLEYTAVSKSYIDNCAVAI